MIKRSSSVAIQLDAVHVSALTIKITRLLNLLITIKMQFKLSWLRDNASTKFKIIVWNKTNKNSIACIESYD